MNRKPKITAGHFLKKYKSVILLCLLPLFLAVFVIFWSVNLSPIASQSGKPQSFVIKKGESLSSIALRLEKEKLIRNQLVFKFFVISQGLTKKIQAGSFKLNPSLSVQEVVSILIHGFQDLWLTFPEGWRKEEYAQRLAANLNNFNSPEFLDLLNSAEGKLFPDTYLISQEASPSAVVGVMFRNFEKKTQGLNLNQEDLILASIVEREVRRDADRPVVAGILLKRWQKSWPLQADATVQYAIGTPKDWWPPITKQDLEISSPYNTYKHPGLPPTPICNPGLSSIKAVLNSEQTDFWFYISDNQGQIHYAKTIEEHNQNIAKYLK